jgi:hypothetical protein
VSTDLGLDTEPLRKLLEATEQEHEQLSAQLAVTNDRLRRLRRAIDALTGPDRKAPAPPASKTSGGQRVSPEHVERVYEAFAAHGEPIAPTALAKITPGLYMAMMGPAVNVLRQQGRLRLVGKTKGGGRAYTIVSTNGRS